MESNRYAPPGAVVQDVSSADGVPELAGRGIRLGAALIDLVVIMGLMGLVHWLTPLKLFDADTSFGTLVRNGLVGFVVFVALNGALLVRHGQTIGKKLTGIRIVRPDGEPASPARVFGLRYGIGYLLSPLPTVQAIFGLVDVLMIFGASRRCLHDLIADTIVVRA